MDEVIELMLEKSHRKEEGLVAWNESPKGIVEDLIGLINTQKTCDIGDKCPVYIYDNNDGVGGKTGDRIL